MSAIELHGVAKRFDATPILTDVDLVVADGSTTAILGASGSGKTTLLRLIAGFDRIDTGTISVDGHVVDDGRRTVRAQERGIGYVPQEGALFPHLTVARNIQFGMPKEDRVRVGDLVELVGLAGLERRYPHQLSGGQQQRVALARALAIRPRVVLLDEPFSSLDASLRTGLRHDVARVLAETATTTVLVTHDQDEALTLADQIAVLRDGRVVAAADPRALYEDPPDLVAATSIGEVNILVADIDDDRAHCMLGSIAVDPTWSAHAKGPGFLLLRPEQLVLHLQANESTTTATVVDLEYHGHDALVHVVVDPGNETPLLARVPGDLVLHEGQRVWVEVRSRGHVWSAGAAKLSANSSTPPIPT